MYFPNNLGTDVNDLILVASSPVSVIVMSSIDIPVSDVVSLITSNAFFANSAAVSV